MWIDNANTVKLGIVNSPPAAMKIYYYKTSAGSFYVNSVSVANGSSVLIPNGTSLALMALPDSGYGWKNYTVGVSAYTTNFYTYTVTANVSIWCYFFLPGTPTPYITARFRFSPTNGTVNHNVTFTDLSVSSGAITGYNWSFGDISFSLLQNPSHNYTAIGLYNVTLTITGVVGSNLMWHGLNVSSDYVAQIADVAGLANLDFVLVIVAVVLAVIGLLFWASKRD
jgi:PKD repeat protein